MINLLGPDGEVVLKVEPQTPSNISPDNLSEEVTYSRDFVDELVSELGDFKPQHLKTEVIEKMLRNGVIHSSLLMIKAPILSIFEKSYFDSRDPVVAGFLNQELMPVVNEHLETILTAYEWGASFHEKVFEIVDDLEIEVKEIVEEADSDSEDDSTIQKTETRIVILPTALRLKKLKFNNYTTIDVIKIQKKSNDFDGYVQKDDSSDGIPVPTWKAFLFSPDQTETLWGKTALLPVYPPWFFYEVMSGYMVRYGERSSSPPLIGRAPTGKRKIKTSEGQKVVDNLTWLTDIIKNSNNSRAIVFPAEFDQVVREALWELRELKIEDRTDFFKNMIAWLESTIHQALFAPQQSIARTSDDTGNRALADSQMEAFLITLSRFIGKLQKNINKYIVKQLVELNFGLGIEAKLVTPDVTKEITTRYFQIVSQLIKAKHPQYLNIDFEHLVEQLGMPVRDVPEHELRIAFPFLFMDEDDEEDEDAEEEASEEEEEV